MPKIVPIVEGDGDVEAVPILCRKLLNEMQRWDIQIARPKNAHGCGSLTKPGGLEKFVQLACKEPDCGAVLILMDADKECPRELAESFTIRVQAIGVPYPVAIVVAKCEYEAWLMASLETVFGDDARNTPVPENVEAIVGVKGWLSRLFPQGRIYKETIDQASMTHRLDTELARTRSRSFQRLWHAMEQILAAIDGNTVVVTP